MRKIFVSLLVLTALALAQSDLNALRARLKEPPAGVPPVPAAALVDARPRVEALASLYFPSGTRCAELDGFRFQGGLDLYFRVLGPSLPTDPQFQVKSYFQPTTDTMWVYTATVGKDLFLWYFTRDRDVFRCRAKLP